jgi:hypothetical protein
MALLEQTVRGREQGTGETKKEVDLVCLSRWLSSGIIFSFLLSDFINDAMVFYRIPYPSSPAYFSDPYPNRHAFPCPKKSVAACLTVK